MRVMRLRSWLSAVIVMTLLSGCVTVHSDLETNVTVKTVCPELVKYDRATQAKIAEELEQRHGDAILPEIMNDYAKVRDICRKIGPK